MKIVFVSTFTPATNYTRDLSRYFYKILKPRDELFLCGRKVEEIQDNDEPQVDHVWSRDLSFVFTILKYVLERRPDVVHLQHEIKMFGGIITSMLYPWLLFLIRLFGFPVVVTIHGVVSPKQIDEKFLESFNVGYTPLKQFVVKLFFRYIYSFILFFSNKVTVHAPALREILVDEYGGGKNRVVVISHGIREVKNVDRIPARLSILKKYPAVKGKKVILVFGYFSPRKGYEFLIQALSTAFEMGVKRNGVVLALVGDVKDEFKPYKRKVLRLIRKEKMEKNVLITGYVDDNEIDEFYRYSYVVLIPAIISFNTSGSLSLSLAYQKPLLVSDVKPLGREVSENDFGLLYEPDNVDSCAKQIARIMTEKRLYESMKKKLSGFVGKRYWTRISKEHYSLYEKLSS